MCDNTLQTKAAPREVEAIGPTPRPDSELRESAEAAVKRELLVAGIAEQTGLAATREEIEERIGELAALGGVTPDQVRERVRQSQRWEALLEDITRRKVFEFLLGQSEVVDEG